MTSKYFLKMPAGDYIVLPKVIANIKKAIIVSWMLRNGRTSDIFSEAADRLQKSSRGTRLIEADSAPRSDSLHRSIVAPPGCTRLQMTGRHVYSALAACTSVVRTGGVRHALAGEGLHALVTTTSRLCNTHRLVTRIQKGGAERKHVCSLLYEFAALAPPVCRPVALGERVDLSDLPAHYAFPTVQSVRKSPQAAQS